MKKYNLMVNQIPHLVELTADLFKTLNNEMQPVLPPAYKPDGMHFIADLLKDLVNTAYPMKKEPKEKYNRQNDDIDALMFALNLKPINKAIIKDIEEGFQEIYKMMQNYKPPKVGEF